MELLNDMKVRSLLLKELKKEYGNRDDTRIINEMGLDFGASRVDVVVINGIMHGYEIKSDLDTLKRLPRQMEYYNKAFERMTIVVTRKYLVDVKQIVPKWWGIKVVSANQTRLITVRKGSKVATQDPEIVIKLLWKKELEGLIDYLGLSKSLKSMRKKQLLSLLREEAEFHVIRKYVYDTLKSREDWKVVLI